MPPFDIRTPTLVALIGLALFLPRITIPPAFVFDEDFYVPGARALIGAAPRLAGSYNEATQAQRLTAAIPEVSHPPLGQFLIAAGIAIAGDNTLGWRLMSAVAGSLCLSAIYLWTWLLLRDRSLALWAAAMTAVNNVLYVMARAAMLDIFCVLFILWALVMATAVVQERISWRAGTAGAGVLFGLALACKWLALAPLVASFCLLLFWRLLALGSRKKQVARDPYAQRQYPLASIAEGVFSLAILPVVVYGATFVPLAWRMHQRFSLSWLLERQLTVIRSHVGHQGPPVQISHWYSWPFKVSPEVFYYGGGSRFILLLGNPLVLWSGVAAITYLCYRLVAGALTHRNLRTLFASCWPELIVVLAYLSLYSQWAIAPRKTMFYHYYFPAAMTLGPALAIAFARIQPKKIFGMAARSFLLVAASLVFIVFFPGLAAIQTGSGWIMQFFFN